VGLASAAIPASPKESIMSIFGAIRDAIFGHSQQAAPAQPAAAQPAAMPQMSSPAAPAAPAAAPAQAVDVDAVLAGLAAQKGQPSNYKTSIVDLMKLLDIDSSLDNRKALAHELGYTGALDGSAEMNMWLHRHAMRQLAANGGRVSADLQG
jgi:3-oxoacyl-ACP reductase-like protein